MITTVANSWEVPSICVAYAQNADGSLDVFGSWDDVPDDRRSALLYPESAQQEITMRQARLALLAAGKLDAVGAAIEALPEPQRSEARIEWEYGSTVQRHAPIVRTLGPALGLSDADLDALFVTAAAL